MIAAVVGHDYSGAREYLAYLAKEEMDGGRTLYYAGAQDEFAFEGSEIFDADVLVEVLEGDGICNSCVCLNRAYAFFDSRNVMGKLNKLFTYFTVTSRTRDNIVLIGANEFYHIDKRIRRSCDVLIECRLGIKPFTSVIDAHERRFSRRKTFVVDLTEQRKLLKVSLMPEEGSDTETPFVEQLKGLQI